MQQEAELAKVQTLRNLRAVFVFLAMEESASALRSDSCRLSCPSAESMTDAQTVLRECAREERESSYTGWRSRSYKKRPPIGPAR